MVTANSTPESEIIENRLQQICEQWIRLNLCTYSLEEYVPMDLVIESVKQAMISEYNEYQMGKQDTLKEISIEVLQKQLKQKLDMDHQIEKERLEDMSALKSLATQLEEQSLLISDKENEELQFTNAFERYISNTYCIPEEDLERIVKLFTKANIFGIGEYMKEYNQACIVNSKEAHLKIHEDNLDKLLNGK